MPSMFECITKKIAKELGDKDMSPVKSLLSATKFREFNILRRKKSLSLFWEQPDIPAEFSLMDILESSSSVPDTVVTGPFSFGVTMVQKQKAGVDVKAGVELSASRVASQFCESFLEIQTVRIPPQTLEDLQQRKLLDPEPSFLQDCWNREDNLYMVTEVVELINSTVLRDSSSKNVLGKFSLWITPGKGQGQSEVLKEEEKMLVVPQGTVMAYKKKQLIIGHNGGSKQRFKEADVLRILDVDKQKTFPKGEFQRRAGPQPQPGAPLSPDPPLDAHKSPSGAEPYRATEPSPARLLHHMLLSHLDQPQSTGPQGNPPSSSEHWDGYEFVGRDLPGALYLWRNFSTEVVGRDFKRLQQEVSQKMEALAQLSKDFQNVMFHRILATLGDRGALQDLMNMLELNPWGQLDGPGGVILNELFLCSDAKYVILYLLEALMVLSDTQQKLLALSIEKKIQLHQQELVRSILETNFKYPWSIPFTLNPKLLSPLQGEGLAITYGLLGKCGLKMEVNSPKSTWDLEAKMPLCALYGTLSLLQQLAEASLMSSLSGDAAAKVAWAGAWGLSRAGVSARAPPVAGQPGQQRRQPLRGGRRAGTILKHISREEKND
ncbi:gasdermin-C-like [Cynocephalus volans]|uniref:gasdermin-C-like n=1 Tax=Cynocephalus volans TaxID=110931 RepID=UPI002FCBCE44